MSAKDYTCRVISNDSLTPTVFQLRFETLEPLSFRAGQFLSMVIPGAGPKGKDLRRAYSIASHPESKQIELCVKWVTGGPGTNYLKKLQPGQEAKFFAPYGGFVYRGHTDRACCFIATGTGISPFRSMIFSEEYRSKPPLRAVLLTGVREQEELLYKKLFNGVSGLKRVDAVSRPTLSGDWIKGRVTDWLRETQEIEWGVTDFYMCGNGAMIDEVKTILKEKGVEKDRVFQEIYYKTAKEAAQASGV